MNLILFLLWVFIPSILICFIFYYAMILRNKLEVFKEYIVFLLQVLLFLTCFFIMGDQSIKYYRLLKIYTKGDDPYVVIVFTVIFCGSSVLGTYRAIKKNTKPK